MARKFLTPIDLNGNQLLGVALENLGNDPGTGVANGRIYYNTSGTLKYYDGVSAIWRTITTGTINTLTFSNTSGAAIGSTFNGSSALTVSFATIGAAPSTNAVFTGTLTTPVTSGYVFANSTGVISSNTAIPDSFLNTISTAGKVLNSATTAASANGASTIVARDANGNLSANFITATLSGNITGTAGSLANALTINTTSGFTLSSGTTFDGSSAKTLSIDPSVIATVSYVDTVATGLNAHDAVKYATTNALANTFTATSGTVQAVYNAGAGGGSGVNANIVVSISGGTSPTWSAITIDGQSLALNDRVLIKDEAAQLRNGIYVVSQVGSAVNNNPFIFTRALDSDQTPELGAGDLVYVINGTYNGGNGFVQTGTVTNVGGSNIIWSQFSGASTTLAGLGLIPNGSNPNQLDINPNSTLAISADQIGINTAWTGQTSINTIGNVTTGTWSANVISATYGGTGTAGTITGLGYFNGTSALTAATGTQVTGVIGTNPVSIANTANKVNVSANTTATAPQPLLWATGQTTSENVYSSLTINVQPSTGTINATAFAGSGAGLTSLNANNISSGILPGARGVSAGNTNVSFIVYNGTTGATGQFDGGSSAPSATQRLNYGGNFYATNFFGVGSNLTALDATQLTLGTVPGDRGVSAGSANSSFIEYNGTTAAAGQFYGGTATPNDVSTILNFNGIFRAPVIGVGGTGTANTPGAVISNIGSSSGLQIAVSNVTGTGASIGTLTLRSANNAYTLSTSANTAAINILGGALSEGTAVGTASPINIIAGTANTSGNAASSGGSVFIQAGSANPTAGIGGSVNIAPGTGSTNGIVNVGTTTTTTLINGTLNINTAAATVFTSAVGGGSGATTSNVSVSSGAAAGGGGAGVSGSILIDVGSASGAGGTTAGNILIGTRSSLGFGAPPAVNIGQSTTTTTVLGTFRIPNVTSNTTNALARINTASGQIFFDSTTAYLTSSTGVANITGTANQVIASASTGAVTLSLPQSIGTANVVQFGALGIGTTAPSIGITVGNGKITTATSNATFASILVSPGSADPSAPVSGDLWNNAGVLKFRDTSVTRVVALTDAAGLNLSSTINGSSLTRIATLSAGTTGSVVRIDASGNLTADSSTFAKKYSVDNGALTASSGQISWIVTHSLNTSNVLVQMYQLAAGAYQNALVDADVVVTNANAVTISFVSGNLTGGEYRAVVIG